MISIEETIKREEEVAEAKERSAKSFLMETDKIKADGILRVYDYDEYESCMKCASDHRQLAEWLRELKAYKDARVGCEYCKHNYREQHERPCSLCQRNFMDMFERGVNADDNIQS